MAKVMRTLFRIGPVLLLIPLALWAWAWTNIVTGEDQSWYIVRPIQGVVVLAALWHIALVVVEKGRRVPYFVYAVLYMPAFYFAAIIAHIYATHFPV